MRLNSNLLFLVVVIGVGAILRLVNLAGKSPWVDEFATIVFSLGNSFSWVTLDQTISFQELVAPLAPNSSTTINDTIRLIFTEDQHPPLYFIFSHLWLKLFPAQQGLVNLWGARSLSAIFGIVSIPVIYIASYLVFRSNLIARSTSLIMALSPYGIYLAQEARHYSLAVIWVIISLACFLITCQYFIHQKRLPIMVVIAWLLANNLGMATHYFFLLMIGAESIGLCLFTLWYLTTNQERGVDLTSIVRLSIVAIFTAIAVAIWLKLYRDAAIPGLTSWMAITVDSPLYFIDPFFRVIAYFITIFCVLFAESPNKFLAITSILVMLPFFVWLSVVSYRTIVDRWQYASLQYKSGIVALTSFFAGAIILFMIFPLLMGMDITLAPRYQFVYFPSVLILAGVAIAKCWKIGQRTIIWLSGKKSVIVILTMGIIGSLVIALNQGYYKPYAPDELVSSIEQSAPTPTLIAITHNSLTESGALMTIAWEMQQVRHSKSTASTHFLLAHQNDLKCRSNNCVATSILRKEVDRLSTPTDLWLVNFFAPINLPDTCSIDKQSEHQVTGYEYKLYHCKINE